MLCAIHPIGSQLDSYTWTLSAATLPTLRVLQMSVINVGKRSSNLYLLEP